MSSTLDDAKPLATTNAAGGPSRSAFWGLTIGSVGVVYGDIGTSPLYAFREAIKAASGGGAATPEIVLGVLSLIVWSLIIIVTLKYVVVLLRADNNGEGGTLSLTALAFRALGRRTPLVLILGMMGAAMFYGSSFLTPALSVMSAVEGLNVASPAFRPYVLPITVLILVVLFAVQPFGTARVSALFGPITCVWFVVIAILGGAQIASAPMVLMAFDPLYAVQFLWDSGWVGLITLAAVFLVVTGAEALYADLGHFGRKPIQAAWFILVLPALLINYFGQGALVLVDPAAADDPFYRLVPEMLLIPMVMLATAATVIASQAVITGAFSMTRQAIQLGLLPRLTIRHTSESYYGQIYIPRVNGILFIGVVLLVLLFRSSSALAAAYVLAVAAVEFVATPLGFIVIWKSWKKPLWLALSLMVPFLIIDVTFVSATMMRLAEGAWVPVLFGVVVILVMATWQRGVHRLTQKTRKVEVPLDDLVRRLEAHPPHIVPGTAVFLTADPEFAPTALLHNLKHNKVLHENNVILTVVTIPVPRVDLKDRVAITPLSPRFTRISLTFGYMETPNVPKALAVARRYGWHFDIMSTSFYLSRRTLRPTSRLLPRWQNRLFIGLTHWSSDATSFFNIPTDRVVEIGTQVAV